MWKQNWPQEALGYKDISGLLTQTRTEQVFLRGGLVKTAIYKSQAYMHKRKVWAVFLVCSPGG